MAKKTPVNPCEICRTGDGKGIFVDGIGDAYACDACTGSRHVMRNARDAISYWRDKEAIEQACAEATKRRSE